MREALAARRSVAHLYLAVALSGAASLVYQVAWTRRLIGVTSATATAQGLVLAVFMAGLGVGAYFAGRRAARLARPLAAYALVELGGVAGAALSVPVISASEKLRDLVGIWGQLGGVALFLLVPTTLIGASLPLVIEHAERTFLDDVPAAGRAMSWLYGVNTLGACAGCLLAGFHGIERWGLRGTTLAGGALAAAAAAIALVASRATPARDVEAGSSRSPRAIVAAAAVAGFVGLAAEVVWTRLVSLVVLNTVFAFSQVLAAVLLGIGAGALLAGVLIRSGRGDVRRLAGLTQVLAAVMLSVVPVLVVRLAADKDLEVALAGAPQLGPTLALIGLLTPPAALLAATLPLLVMAADVPDGARAFGALYGANTAGSVLGSLAAAWLLIPLLGTQGATALLAALALGLGALLLSRKEWVVITLAAVTSLVLLLAVRVPRHVHEARLPEGVVIRELREGVASDVMVTDDDQGRRRIWINSAWVAGTGGGHRVLGHLPSLFVERPVNGAGIALGTGQTFAAVMRHGFERFDCVEIDAGVIDLSTRWFREANGALFEHPQVHLHHEDGRAFLRTTQLRYDLIVLEPLQAWSAGTSNLYSKEFYLDARRVLSAGGVVAQWIPFYGQGVEETRAMVRAGAEVFPEASLWLDAQDGILILQNGRFTIDPRELASRISRRGIAGELARNDVAASADLLALWVLGPKGVAAWVEGAPLLTDDRPFLEFRAARALNTTGDTGILASLRPHLDDPARYLADTSSIARSAALNAARIRDAVLAAAALPEDDHAGKATAIERGMKEVPGSGLLLGKYRELILQLGRTPDVAQAIAAYRRGLAHAPQLGEVAVNLGIAYARTGNLPAARRVLEHATHLPDVAEAAQQILASLPASTSTTSR